MAQELNRCVVCNHFYKGNNHTCVDTSRPIAKPSDNAKPVPLPKKPE